MDHSEDVKRICAKAYLEHVRDLAVKVKTLDATIKEQRDELLPGALSYKEHVTTSLEIDAMEKAICDLQELIADFATELAGYIDEQRTAHKVLWALENPAHAAALSAYYIDAKSWDEVRETLGYSWQGIMKLRKKALCEVYDLMPENWRREPIPNAI